MNLFGHNWFFQSYGSGSSGNCYFIGNEEYGILIDAGVSSRKVRKCLQSIGLTIYNIRAVFITHDHADHISSVAAFGERFLVPVYATTDIHKGIANNYSVTQKLERSKRFLEKKKAVAIEAMTVTAFPVSHDATDSVGYAIEFQGKKITIATDLGEISAEAAEHLRTSDYIVIEANYDDEMLRNGTYPYLLQERIRAATGHLSNAQTADFLAKNYTKKWQKIFLCHLSKDNNSPQTARETVENALKEKKNSAGKNVEVLSLPRTTPTMLFEL
ncbi:MAG: MBL fold metallo-hydrolase [Prevotellaceae bacterium]|jgi:phosphoribosyl 1,2-cyclic phosphodiesterase|nr:MBL fold metallo-hydrolase [Prevotellaceae bacterium]